MISLAQPNLSRKEVSESMNFDEYVNSRYILHPFEGMEKHLMPTGRVTGHRVLLYRLENEMARSAGGIFIRDTYQHGSSLFKCLAVGPGGWAKEDIKKQRIDPCEGYTPNEPFNLSARKRFKWVYIKPEIQVGDLCVSYHFDVAVEHPDWIQPHYLDEVDGSGRVILDSRFVVATYTPEKI